jgi:predicted enzyme related to lactoylglutathione lyase
MALELNSVLLRSPDPERSASFWGAMTDRPWAIDSMGVFVAGTPTQVGLRFADGPLHAKTEERLHLHLSHGKRNQREWIDTCVAGGATLLGSGNIPPGSYARMADPVGEEYCVIEDNNRYLEGCGPLGEVTCEGTHAVGLFWGQALRWPIVWDQNQEVAIQSPRGGTKLAWSGIAPSPDQRNSGKLFVCFIGSKGHDEEIGRLVSLGATVREIDPTGTSTLIDPDGVDFLVVRAESE